MQHCLGASRLPYRRDPMPAAATHQLVAICNQHLASGYFAKRTDRGANREWPAHDGLCAVSKYGFRCDDSHRRCAGLECIHKLDSRHLFIVPKPDQWPLEDRVGVSFRLSVCPGRLILLRRSSVCRSASPSLLASSFPPWRV